MKEEKMKINKLEIENVKRVKAVRLEPTTNGLTIIGGDNGQGKTSVLDAIAWALGGDRYAPSKPQRDGSTIPPYLKIVMDNGLVVERKGKNSSLVVIDPDGQKNGQQLLNSFVEELAINLPKFINSTSKEKANILLQIIGVGDKLATLELKEKEIYNKRHTIGQIADQKKKFAEEQKYYPEAPKELVSASTLIKQQQEILARNGENMRKRQHKATIERDLIRIDEMIKEAEIKLKELYSKQLELTENLNIANKDILDLVDESTQELENSINDIDTINIKVRANLDKEKAEDDAKEYTEQYAKLSTELSSIRDEKANLLTSSNLPLPGLTIEDGELVYNNQKWDNMSSSEQLIVSASIIRKLKPQCGFILLDKLEQMDLKTLKTFGQWLEQEGLQAIATRVSTGEECSIIIEDGYVKGEQEPIQEEIKPKWEAGKF